MIELIIATLIFIQSPQDLKKDCDYSEHATLELWGCMRWSDNTIHILGGRPEKDMYRTLYHEQGHNLFHTYPMPTIFKGEEQRAIEFSWWMYEKKFAQPNTYILKGDDIDRYFKAICNEECIKALLDLKL